MNLRPSTRTTLAAGAALVGLALVAGLLAWPRLPEPMAIHWNVAGEPDGYASRFVGVVLLPLVAGAMLLLFELLPRIDPLGENVAAFRGYYNGFVLLVTAFFVALQGVVVAANLGYPIDVGVVVTAGAGLLFAYVGVLLRHAEPNWFVGIRTPWTLASETVWRRTHALGGRLFVGGGLALFLGAVVLAVVGRDGLLIPLLVAVLIPVTAVPIAYSYYCYETLGRPDDRPTT